MRYFLASLIATGALTAVAPFAAISPASAQQSEAVLDSSPADLDRSLLRRDAELEARRVLSDFVECVIARNPRGLVEYLAATPNTPQAHRLGTRLVGGGRARASQCLNRGELRFVDSLLRGAVFEMLFRRDYTGRELPRFFDMRLASDTPVVPQDGNEEARRWNALNRFSNCVVRLDTQSARALILSDVNGNEETEAFGALQEDLNRCMYFGSELSFSRPLLRGIIAEALYMHAKAAFAQPGPMTLADISGEGR
ncbi:MAG: hypothetical protein ABR601_04060 [Parasphingopyxis sp.]|nr:hypothetical protein [Sphingomonadales bacterium]